MFLSAMGPRGRHIAAAGALTVTVLAVIGSVSYGVGHRHGELTEDEWRPLVPAVETASTPSPLPATDVARDAIGRVVTVEVVRDGAQALGTGWLLDTRGDFVTNAHVVQGGRGVRLRDRAGHTHLASVVGNDRDRDLAVLRSADGFAGTPLPIGSDPLAVPQPVVTLSAARATGHEDSATERVVRLHVDVPVRGNSDIDPAMGATTVVYRDMMGLEGARIFSGNSGGPVLDLRGRVIGIVTLASRSEPRAFAIPIGRVIAELLDLARR